MGEDTNSTEPQSRTFCLQVRFCLSQAVGTEEVRGRDNKLKRPTSIVSFTIATHRPIHCAELASIFGICYIYKYIQRAQSGLL